ncbi:MAG: DNA polymerase I, partial [Coxiellaceae bacterium]|nr:DNA polymerase I [Coxiellaceae bacterium]
QASVYAAEDADITLQLHQHLWPRIIQEDNCKTILTEIEIPLMRVLSKIERNGVLIDANMLAQQSAKMAVRIDELVREIYTLAGQEFNVSSPKQLIEILFDKLQLPVIKRTPKGQPSTAEAILQELAIHYELPSLILEYRSLSKLKSTYTDKLPKEINAKTGRVHTSYNQAVTTTGRLSSTDPNLQNIPVKTEAGRLIRQAFIAPEGFKIVSADYSQIELRIMAHLSQDETLVSAFNEGLDIHRITASEVFGVPLDQVTDEQRRSSKAINFGLIYGMSAFGLARQLRIERSVAAEYMDVYFARYPGVKTYMEQTIKQAHQQGYVETLMGRRLYLNDINSKDPIAKRAAERTAINAPMQGTAADLIKLAMINIDDYLDQSVAGARMIMQVHDELVFEIPTSEVARVSADIVRLMADAMALSIPLEVSVGVGDNWDEAH